MIIKYQNTDNVLQDVCSIIESVRDYDYQSVNIALVERNWFIGYRGYVNSNDDFTELSEYIEVNGDI